MTDRESFLAAIIANPADDLPRLVYADWLEENDGVVVLQKWDDDMGNLYTVQVNNGFAERAKLIRFAIQFADEVKEDGYPNMRTIFGIPLAFGFGMSRGFVTFLKGSLSDLLTHGPAICREHPVESVEVTDAQPWQVGGPSDRLPWHTFVESRPGRRGYSAMTMEESVAMYNAAVLRDIKEPK